MNKNRQLARWLISALIAVTGVAMMIYLHYSYLETLRSRNQLRLEEITSDARDLVVRTIQSRLTIVQAVEAYMVSSGGKPSQEEFDTFARSLMAGTPEMQAVYVSDEQWRIRYCVSQSDEAQDYRGADVYSTPAATTARRAVNRHTLTFSDHIHIPGSPSAFIACKAIYDGRGELRNVVSVVLSADQIRTTLNHFYANDLAYSLRDRTGVSFAGNPYLDESKYDLVNREVINLSDNVWTMVMTWRQLPHRANMQLIWLNYGLGSGAVVILLLIVNGLYARTRWLQSTVNSRTRDLAQTNQELYSSNLALRESEERFRRTFEHASVGIVTMNREGRIVRSNQRFFSIIGHHPDAANLVTFRDLWHPDDQAEAVGLFDRVLGPLPYRARAELRCQRPNRDLAWLRITMSPVPEAEGDGLIVLVADDITEARTQALELAETRALMENAFNNLGEAVLVLDPLGERILARNSAVNDIFYYEPHELLTTEHLHLDMSDYVEFRAMLSRTAPGEPLVMKTRMLRKDGEILSVELVATALNPAGSEASDAGIVMVVRDVTETERAAEALRTTNRELQDALAELHNTQQRIAQQERLRALGQLASGIAHDFNNALAVISGFTDRLLNKPKTMADPAKARRYLELIATSANDAAKIVNRMRDFYRPRASTEHHEELDLRNLLIDVVHLTEPKWKTQAQAKGRQIRVHTHCADHLPTLYGHPSELREMLTNLVMNAVDAMPDGGTITISAEPAAAAVALRVADTGTGMTDEVRAHCLEPFFTTKGHDEGSGLGLAMVYGIINRHNGTVEIETEVGKGTTFIITLPVNKPAFVQPQVTIEMAPGDRQLDILVVEDDPSVRELLHDYLVDDGHRVTEFSDGRNALIAFRDGHFDLVITDRAMPGMSGDELANSIKIIAPRIPIILVSGFGDMMLGADERPPNFDLILGKPVDVGTLRKAISELTLHIQTVSRGAADA